MKTKNKPNWDERSHAAELTKEKEVDDDDHEEKEDDEEKEEEEEEWEGG